MTLLLLQPNLIFLTPEIFIGITMLGLILWSLAVSNKATQRGSASICLILWSFTTLLMLLLKNLNKTKLLFLESFLVNNYTTTCKIIACMCVIAFLLLAFVYNLKNQVEIDFSLLILFASFATLLLISAHDLITMYLTLEMQSLCLYILATLKKTSRFSTEAGLKYFLINAFASTLLLIGTSLIYGGTLKNFTFWRSN